MRDETTADQRPPVTERTMQIDEIKTRVERNEYDVDPRAVADAILALLLRRQSRCS